jgi:ketosteroid isomerase-like protein
VIRSLASAAILVVPALAAVPDGPPASRPILVTVEALPAAACDAMLDALATHRVRALGFVIWSQVRADDDRRCLARWIEAGHELGVLGGDAIDFHRARIDDFLTDVESGRAKLERHVLDGAKPRYFRYPFLHEGTHAKQRDAARRYLADAGLRSVPATIVAPPAEVERDAHEAEAAWRAAIRRALPLADAILGRTAPQIVTLRSTAEAVAVWPRVLARLVDGGGRFAAAEEVLTDPIFAEPAPYDGPLSIGLWDRLRIRRDEEDARREASDVLKRQVESWNRGDLVRFWSQHTEDAVAVDPGGVTVGRGALFQRSMEAHPDRTRLGTLVGEILETRPVATTETTPWGEAIPGRVAGMTLAVRFTLTLPSGETHTWLATKVLARRPDGWRIVHEISY